MKERMEAKAIDQAMMSQTPVNTSSDVAQQQIEQAPNPQIKGRKEDPLSDVYTTDNSTLQTKEEHEHDKNVHPNRNNKIDIADLREKISIKA